MASHDVEHAGGGGGDDDAGLVRRSVAPVDGGREVGASWRTVLASVKVPTTVEYGVQRRCSRSPTGRRPAVSGASAMDGRPDDDGGRAIIIGHRDA